MLRRTVRLVVVLALVAGCGAFATAGKRVTLVVDGRVTSVRTYSFSVGQLVARRGIHLGPEDVLTPDPRSRLRDGLRIEIRHAPRLRLLMGGRTEMLPVPFDLGSIGAALAWARVPLAPADVVTPSRESRLHHGMTVRVTQVRVRTITRVEAVPFPTVTRYDPQIPVGVSRVESPGYPGQEIVTYRLRVEDGRVTKRTVVRTQRISLPVAAHVAVGTNSREREATWQLGQASWYERGGVGAAHRWLPKGTVVTVTDLDTGRSITVIIDDRGPYGVPGRVVDLSKEAFARLAPLAQGVLRVELTW